MKKMNSLILIILITILLCSCNNKDINETKNLANSNEYIKNSIDKEDNKDLSQQNNEPKKLEIMDQIEEMTDEELLGKYVYLFCYNINMTFDNTLELSSEDLFDYFLHSLWVGDGDDNEKWEIYADRWRDSTTGIFSISEEDIIDQLDRYFKEYKFNIKEIDSYNPLTDKIEIGLISGWGGASFEKLRDKIIDYETNRIELIVDYYEDVDYQNIYLSKDYIFELYEDGFYLIKCKIITEES